MACAASTSITVLSPPLAGQDSKSQCPHVPTGPHPAVGLGALLQPPTAGTQEQTAGGGGDLWAGSHPAWALRDPAHQHPGHGSGEAWCWRRKLPLTCPCCTALGAPLHSLAGCLQSSQLGTGRPRPSAPQLALALALARLGPAWPTGCTGAQGLPALVSGLRRAAPRPPRPRSRAGEALAQLGARWSLSAGSAASRGTC